MKLFTIAFTALFISLLGVSNLAHAVEGILDPRDRFIVTDSVADLLVNTLAKVPIVILAAEDVNIEKVVVNNPTNGGSVPHLTYPASNEDEKSNALLSWTPNEIDFLKTKHLDLVITSNLKEPATFKISVEVIKQRVVFEEPIPTSPPLTVADWRGRYLIQILPEDTTKPIRPAIVKLTEYYLSNCTYTYRIEMPISSNAYPKVLLAPLLMSSSASDRITSDDCGRVEEEKAKAAWLASQSKSMSSAEKVALPPQPATTTTNLRKGSTPSSSTSSQAAPIKKDENVLFRFFRFIGSWFLDLI